MISEILEPKRSEEDRWAGLPERGTPASLEAIAWIGERFGRALARLLLLPDRTLLSNHGTRSASGVLRIPEARAWAFGAFSGMCFVIFITLPPRFWTAFICCAVNSTGFASQFTGKKYCSAKMETGKGAFC